MVLTILATDRVEAGSLRDAIGQTRPLIDIRLRYESVDDAGFDRNAEALTPLATLHAFQGWANIFLNTPRTWTWTWRGWTWRDGQYGYGQGAG